MEPVILNNDDVVSVDKEETFVDGSTFTVAEAMAEIEELFERCKSDDLPRKQWVSSGVECKCMSQGNGWRKGKVRVALEFILDENSELTN